MIKTVRISSRLGVKALQCLVALAFVVALIGVLPVQTAQAAICSTVNLRATEDTHMRDTRSTFNYGRSNPIRVDTQFALPNYGALLRWDLTPTVSGIPAYATVTGVSLTLNVTNSSNSVIELYNMRRPWIEGNNDGSSGSGASWDYYNGAGSAWGGGGASSTTTDRFNTNLWNATSSSYSSNGSRTVAFNISGIGVVQGWVTGSTSNYGLTMQHYADVLNDLQFSSSEDSTAANRPTLNVTYCVPEIVTSVASLPAFSTPAGTPSTSQSYTVSGTYLSGNITVTAPASFQISTDNATFASSLTLTASGGTVATTTVYARLNSATKGPFSGNITHTSANATTVNVAVSGTAENRAPVADDQSVSTAEDTALPITLTATDADSDPLTWTVGDPAHGTLTGTAPALTYTPDENYFGADSFTFHVNDGTVDSNTATITIDVTAVNDTPVANAQSVSTAEDTALPITLTATDVESTTFTWTVGDPAHGTLTGTAPDLTYTPDENYFGADSFTFHVNDGTVDSNTATITIDVTSVNDAPVADDQSVSTPEDTDLDITLTASDVENDELTWTVGEPEHGTLTGVAPDLTYTPDENYFGADSFTFFVEDEDQSNTATVTIDVTSVNDAPVADDQSVSTAEDTALDITLTASDVENDVLTWTVDDPAHGTLTGTAPDLTYTPDENYFGADSFTFFVEDEDQSNTATISINVTSVNDAPVADDQSVSTAEDTDLDITLTASDVENDELTWTVGEPEHGTLTGVAPDLTYTPDENYFGADSFTFFVEDEDQSNTATVTIDVTSVNDAPVADDQSVSTAEDTALDITLTASDVENDELTWTVGDPAHGTLTGTAPDLTYTPDENYFGADSFTFSVNDGEEDSNTATITIDVTSVNDAPVANNQSVSTPEDTALDITLTASDVEGDELTWTVGDPAHGTLTGTAPDLTYTPDADYNGPDSFTFFVNDGEEDSNTATISINVTGSSDAPVITGQVVLTTAEDTALTIMLGDLTVTDIDNTYPDDFTLNVLPGSHYTVEGDTITPALNFHGDLTVPVTVNDGVNDSAAFDLLVTVTPVNDAPVATAQSVEARMNLTTLITLSGTDVEGDAIVDWEILTQPQRGNLLCTDDECEYIPTIGYQGSDSFTFRVQDEHGAWSEPATISITVIKGNLYYLPVMFRS